jgi:HAD superfamily hydrolase (TIGR01509 family)|tara:strand:- start:143 stop:856 length:714 start_codon:yes stop_codon:yes gene_type:complete
MNRYGNLRNHEARTFHDLLNAASLVVLDFDGVIADSEVISLSTLQTSLHDFGIQLTLDEARAAFLGTSLKTILSYVRAHGTGDMERFAEHWEHRLFDQFRVALAPVASVLDLLETLNISGVPYCIASSGTFRRIRIALDAMKLTNRFKHIYSSEQVVRGKPAPDLFELAARDMGSAAKACLVIEDSPYGVRAAKTAGMRCVGFTGGQHLNDLKSEHGSLLLEEGADMVLSSYDQLAL